MASLTISSSNAVDAALDDELGGGLAGGMSCGGDCRMVGALCLCGTSQIVDSPAQSEYKSIPVRQAD